MCDAGEVIAGDIVLEIGPGTGVLTREIMARKASVIAIETDPRALALLRETFGAEIADAKLTLVKGDMRTLPLAALGLNDHNFKVIANIPYYLSGFLLRIFLENNIQPQMLVFLMQKEVVARIARDPKESILSLSVKAFGTPKYIRTITKGHFSPAPKVDSAILQVKDINRDHFRNSAQQKLYFSILHLGFGQKRKQLLANLTTDFQRHELEDIFNRLSIPLNIRAEDVPLSQWLKLTSALTEILPLNNNL